MAASGSPALPDGAIRALIVGAHEATRIGLSVMLGRQPWVARCLLAETPSEARQMVLEQRPEVTVLDISALGPFVASATDALRSAHPAMPIVLTSPCSAQMTPPIGAHTTAFLPSSASGAEIVRAVREAVLAGHDDPAPRRSATTAPRPELTDREREVLELLSLGLTNREIAGRLHLGPDSIKKHARSLYRKLGVRNRTEAAHHALRLFAA
jgi:DNA-binding NarL/FixJ family response regulator